MGHRELKRVPLDFDAPLKKVWKGYINIYPYPPKCEACDGSGYNPETKRIADDFYSYSSSTGEGWCNSITQDEVEALVKAGRLWEFTRRPVNKEQEEYMPTAEEVNKWNHRGLGHDAINRGYLIETRAKRLGVYGYCYICEGEGVLKFNERLQKLYDDWQEYEPPTGDGYQLWETCSEGSPVSPVFSSAEELASWCEDNATVFAREKTSKENWLKMFLKDEVGCGSMMIAKSGYIGSVINDPNNK
jgi:hypothetical protein